VERAKQERQQKIVQAEGEAEAAKMISFIMETYSIFFTKIVSSCFVF
jgi:prohibitin 2